MLNGTIVSDLQHCPAHPLSTTTVRSGLCKVVRLGSFIYQILKESGDLNKLRDDIIEFEGLCNIAAVAQLSIMSSTSASKLVISDRYRSEGFHKDIIIYYSHHNLF